MPLNVQALAQSLDHDRPGNFFFAMPMSKPNEQVMRGHAKSVPCLPEEADRYSCYCPDATFKNSSPPMGRGMWMTYGAIVMFQRPLETGEMVMMPIMEFINLNPQFDIERALCESASRPDLGEVLKAKLGGQQAFQAPDVQTTVNTSPSPFRDVTFESSVVDRQINDKDQ